MSNISLDGHKLMYHPQRVADWLRDEDVCPIYIEISLVNNCNYRCFFCAFDYTGYTGGMLDGERLCTTIQEMADCGVKSIVFAGTGEPLVHPDLVKLVNHTVSCGIDVGLSTNGALLNEDTMKALVKTLSWIRISFNAGNAKSYAKIHGCAESKYEVVKTNIARLVALKRETNSKITIGVQSLILEENKDEFLSLATTMKDIGVDYFSLKPYSPHPDSLHVSTLDSTTLISDKVSKQVESLSNDSFTAVVRRQSMSSLQKSTKPYKKCLGLAFLCYLEADGLVYACNTFVGDTSCTYGNINEMSFSEIWNSEKRKQVMQRLSCMSQKQCRQACRLDQINQYLWAIKNPSGHVNFI